LKTLRRLFLCLAGAAASLQAVSRLAWAQARDGRDLAVGRLSVIDNHVDPARGTIRFKTNFDNTNEALSPGQSVDIRMLGYRAIGGSSMSGLSGN
jgi:multidrug efflux pump subunit AcrA (membrane-fusion protein)